MNKLDLARRWYQEADAKRWRVAWIAYHAETRKNILELADAIGRTEDTVRNLADAYSLFAELIRHFKSSELIRQLRRKHPYTKFSIVYRQWMVHEFELEEAKDWLENFEGSNAAMSAEIENKHGAPEWERRANLVYRQADKLRNDFGVPDGLARAAAEYVKEFDKAFPKVKR